MHTFFTRTNLPPSLTDWEPAVSIKLQEERSINIILQRPGRIFDRKVSTASCNYATQTQHPRMIHVGSGFFEERCRLKWSSFHPWTLTIRPSRLLLLSIVGWYMRGRIIRDSMCLADKVSYTFIRSAFILLPNLATIAIFLLASTLGHTAHICI